MCALLAAIGAGYYFATQSARSAARKDALALADRGTPEAARLALIPCLERNPDDAELLAAVVRTMERAGTPDAEIEPYAARWCRAQPNDPNPFRAQLRVLPRLGRMADAIAAAERVLELAPDDREARKEVSRLYFEVGRLDEASRECRRLLETAPDPPLDLWISLGVVESMRGNLAEAAAWIDRVLAIVPDHPAALISRGAIHYQMGEFPEAIALLRQARPKTPDDRVQVLHHLGLSLSRMGRDQEAKAAFAELDRLQTNRMFIKDARARPDTMATQIRAARALLETNEPDAAGELLDAAIARIGPNRASLELLAEIYARQSRLDAAADARARAARLP